MEPTIVPAEPVFCGDAGPDVPDAPALWVALLLSVPFAPSLFKSALACGYNNACTASSELNTSPKLPSFAVRGLEMLSTAQLRLQDTSSPLASQARAAPFAETSRTLLMSSATIGAARAARASDRTAIPLKARWSVLHFPFRSQKISTRIGLSSERWKVEEASTSPLTASVQFCAPLVYEG